MSIFTPEVDIVVTSFNSMVFIEEALNSILYQKYKNWKIIFIDDASTDGTVALIKAYIKKNRISKKCKLFILSDNCGYGMSLKTGIERGENSIVFIVDSDDAFATDEAITVMVKEHLLHPDVSLIYSNYYECDVELKYTTPIICRPPRPGETYLGKFSNDVYLGSHLKVSHLKSFKRESYNMTEGLNPNLMKAVDTDLILKLEEVGRLHHVNKTLYYHRKQPRSISNSFRSKSDFEKQRIMSMKAEMYLASRERRRRKNSENIS